MDLLSMHVCISMWQCGIKSLGKILGPRFKYQLGHFGTAQSTLPLSTLGHGHTVTLQTSNEINSTLTPGSQK